MNDNSEDFGEMPVGSAEMERLLSRLTPVRPRLDASAVLAETARRNQAALRAVRQQVWLWRAVAVGMAASLALLAWIHDFPTPANRSDNQIVHMISVVPAKPAPAPTSMETLPRPSSSSYLILRQQVLTHGLDALRDPPGTADSPEPRGSDSPIGRIRPDGGI